MTACASSKSTTASSNQIELANINVQLGTAYLANGDPMRAKQKLLMAMQEAPRYPASWYAMGLYLEKTGEKGKAKEYYQKAIQLGPQDGAAQNNYGTFLCRQKQYRESIKHFMIAVNDPGYLSGSEAYENAGICALQIPDKKLAENLLAKSLQIDPARPVPLIELAKLKSAQGDNQLALDYIERFLSSYQPTKAILVLAEKIAQQANNPLLAEKYSTLLKKE